MMAFIGVRISWLMLATNEARAAADLGVDKIFVYRLDPAAGKLSPNDPPFVAMPPGSGPRHFAFHPNGRFAFAINELAATITVFDYDADSGVLTILETVSTLPKAFSGENTTAEVQVHPSGKFLYGSNRGHNSIAIFVIDRETGRLIPMGQQSTSGQTPRNFGIDPTGLSKPVLLHRLGQFLVQQRQANRLTLLVIDAYALGSRSRRVASA